MRSLGAAVRFTAFFTAVGAFAATSFSKELNKVDNRVAADTAHQIKSVGHQNTVARFALATYPDGKEGKNKPKKSPSPALIAHRGGATDFPENTLLAIEGALKNADGVWLTVQLSRDEIPVLYRPADLSTLTNQAGPVSSKTAKALNEMNAGWNFKPSNSKKGSAEYPYRTQPTNIPTLEQALDKILDKTADQTFPVILDMKALPAAPQVDAVARILRQKKYARLDITLYSTEAIYQDEFKRRYPDLEKRLFEKRSDTRNRLLVVPLAGQCKPPINGILAGFELDRPIEIVEKYTLGEGRTALNVPTWTPDTVHCFRRGGQKVRLVAFGVNSVTDYCRAKFLGLDAVLVDSPEAISRVKNAQEDPCVKIEKEACTKMKNAHVQYLSGFRCDRTSSAR